MATVTAVRSSSHNHIGARRLLDADYVMVRGTLVVLCEYNEPHPLLPYKKDFIALERTRMMMIMREVICSERWQELSTNFDSLAPKPWRATQVGPD